MIENNGGVYFISGYVRKVFLDMVFMLKLKE